MNKTLGNIIKYTISLALAAVLVWLVVRKIDWQSFAQGLKTTRWTWMIAYTIVATLALVFRALRWNQLLKPLDPTSRFGKCWDANNIGNLGSIVIPGSCEPIRGGLTTNKNVNFQTVLGTMIMERAWDILFIFLTLVIALLSKWETFGGFVRDNILGPLSKSALFWWIFVLAIAGLVFFFRATYRFRHKSKFLGKVADIIDGVIHGFGSFVKLKNKVPYILCSGMIWVMYMLMAYTCLKALPELSGLDMADALFLSALGNIASIIPVPGGIGAYHYLIILCLSSLYGFSNETGLIYAMLNHEGHAILILVLGIISYIARMVKARKR